MRVAMIDCPFISRHNREANSAHENTIIALLKEHDIVICDASSREGFPSLSSYLNPRAALRISRDLALDFRQLEGKSKEVLGSLIFGVPSSRTGYVVPGEVDPVSLYSLLQELELESAKQPA